MNIFKLFSIFSIIVFLFSFCTKNPVEIQKKEYSERILFIIGGKGKSETCTDSLKDKKNLTNFVVNAGIGGFDAKNTAV